MSGGKENQTAIHVPRLKKVTAHRACWWFCPECFKRFNGVGASTHKDARRRGEKCGEAFRSGYPVR
jgi:hypothetical protein